MAQRLALQSLLEMTLGSENAYFQPPNNLQLEYPCIVYEIEATDTTFADNTLYRALKRYQVTVIDRDPDSEIPDKVALLPMCTHTRTFRTEQLYHHVFNLYF